MRAAFRQPAMIGLGLAVVLTLGGCGGGSGSAFGGGGPGGGSGGGGSPAPMTPLIQDLANQPPSVGDLAILLTDGSVLIQAEPTSGAVVSGASGAGRFYRLTPDANGDYAAGTWTRISSPPTGYAPYAGATAVLPDGRVVVVVGEYNQDNYQIPFAPSALTNMSAVYDPVTDRWTMIAPPPGQAYIGDVPSAILPGGQFVYETKLDRLMWSLDPATLTWSQLASANG